MSARVLLVCVEDPRRRVLEDLLADLRPVVRLLTATPADVPWSGPAPDLLVLGAFGRTALAAELALTALNAELTTLTDEQAKYIGVQKTGPYKTDHYRY